MDLRKSYFIKPLMLSFVLFILLGIQGLCKAQKNLLVPDIGSFNIPDTMQVIKLDTKNVKTMKGLQEKALAKGTSALSDKLKVAKNNAAKPDSININIYELVVNDGDSYHTAFILFIKDKEKSSADLQKNFNTMLNNEQKDSLLAMVNSFQGNLGAINKGLESSLNNNKKPSATDLKIKILGLGPVEFPVINSKQSYAGGVRAIFSSSEFILPAYFYGGVLPGEKMEAAILVCLDSERDFWTTEAKSMLLTYKEK